MYDSFIDTPPNKKASGQYTHRGFHTDMLLLSYVFLLFSSLAQESSKTRLAWQSWVHDGNQFADVWLLQRLAWPVLSHRLAVFGTQTHSGYTHTHTHIYIYIHASSCICWLFFAGSELRDWTWSVSLNVWHYSLHISRSATDISVPSPLCAPWPLPPVVCPLCQAAPRFAYSGDILYRGATSGNTDRDLSRNVSIVAAESTESLFETKLRDALTCWYMLYIDWPYA